MHSLAEHAVIEHYTRDDHQRWEGDWELIQGIPLAISPSPGIAHQRVSGRLYAQLAAALEDCPDCEALFEIDVELAQDTVVRPDVIVICHRPEGDRITQPPELIAEVVSRSTARRDEQTKFELYRQEGVTWYLLLDPSRAQTSLYRLIDGDYHKVSDLHDGEQDVELSACTIRLDGSRLWERP